MVHTGKIDALQRFKDDVSEVKTGFECGISLDNYGDVKQGDMIEAFVTETRRQRSLRLDRCHAAVGVLTLELRLEEVALAQGQAARGARPSRTGCAAQFNVAVAEIDYQDLWQRAARRRRDGLRRSRARRKVLQSVEGRPPACSARNLVDASR